MTIKKSYYYLFYKLYKFWQVVSTPKIWSDWKAELCIDALILLLGASILVYYKVFVNRYFHFGDSNLPVIITCISISLINYFVFHHKSQWKEIVIRFDAYPPESHKRGSFVVGLVILAVIINLIFAFYLMSRVDWSHYR
ncbi:MAG: hypothetical protein J7577_17150 [Sphingobacteriaceae bacterium]|nr:hypothetical protein [Sphingobacteriaceae bacterium]